MSDPFAYHKPTPEMQPHFEAVADACAHAYDVLMREVPESSERTLAIRNLQEVRMWANTAIAGVQVETRGQVHRP